jgi:hypothetical protein
MDVVITFLFVCLFFFPFLGCWIYVIIQWNIQSLVIMNDTFSLERAGGFHLEVQICRCPFAE